ncbi:MAG: nucleoside diphosphate kinase regulator [Calditrichaceae bacterium]|nr:nucleoside diphosphate kinase regulator [Calditrichia bacterium]NUQ43446.1 nucleoside diphosphate kinase regulator [Calditrichaceae bacterium]
METRTIYITEFDKKRLIQLIESHREMSNKKDHLSELENELLRAEIVSPKNVPPDVITMNSKVRIREVNSEKDIICELVFPNDADISKNKISILAPVGTALIGFKVGDIIEWNVPAGLKRFEVLEILYQPEAAGDFHL